MLPNLTVTSCHTWNIPLDWLHVWSHLWWLLRWHTLIETVPRVKLLLSKANSNQRWLSVPLNVFLTLLEKTYLYVFVAHQIFELWKPFVLEKNESRFGNMAKKISWKVIYSSDKKTKNMNWFWLVNCHSFFPHFYCKYYFFFSFINSGMPTCIGWYIQVVLGLGVIIWYYLNLQFQLSRVEI